MAVLLRLALMIVVVAYLAGVLYACQLMTTTYHLIG